MSRRSVMTWRRPGLGLAGFLLLLPLPGCGGCREPAPPRTNLLVISVDTLRPDHLGCYGYERDTSPQIDRLAEEGVLWTDVSSTTNWTLPAHVSLFTGLPQLAHGVVADGIRLDRARRTLAQLLADQGYATAAFVSSPYLDAAFGLDKGFEIYENIGSWTTTSTEERLMPPLEAHDQSRRDETAAQILERGQAWLGQRDERPFFLFAHFWDCHADYAAPPPYDRFFDPDYRGWVDGIDVARRDRYNATMPERDLRHLVARYDGEIRHVDGHVGRLLKALAETGRAEDTLVIFTSDHGEEFFEHGGKTHRVQLYEESVRVPLIMRGPGLVPGRRLTTPVSLMDLLPTILALLEVPGPDAEMLGADLTPLLEGLQAPALDNRPIVTELHHGLKSIRLGDWKLIANFDLQSGLLYHLAADPAEQQNLAETQLLQRDRLFAALIRWNDQASQFAGQLPVSGEDNSLLYRRGLSDHLRQLGYIQ